MCHEAVTCKNQNHDWCLAVSSIRVVRKYQLNTHLSFKMLIKMKIFRDIITLNCYMNMKNLSPQLIT